MQIPQRKNHTDMDAFYACGTTIPITQKENPLQQAVNIEVVAASYRNRKFGVRSAISSKIAKENVRILFFVKRDFEFRYKEISQKIREFFQIYRFGRTFSLDEAYLRCYRKQKKNIESANEIKRNSSKKFLKKWDTAS